MHMVFRAVMAFLGLVAAFLGFSSLRAIRRSGRDSQTALEFNTRRAGRDFRELMAGNMLLLLGFTVFTAGAMTGDHLLSESGEALILLFFLFPIRILYRWRGRLR